MNTLTTRPASRFTQRYGPWALVTGASDGIGNAFCHALAAQGMHLVLVARNQERLAEQALLLSRLHGIQCRVIAADLSRPEQWPKLIEQTRDLHIGLLVAAAGFGTSGPFLAASIENELDMLSVNCAAVTRMSHHFAQRFAAQGRGGIILLSSLLGFQGVARAAHYAATKSYIQSLGEGIAPELKPVGVDVLICAPGPVRSGFASRANLHMGFAASPQAVADAALYALGRQLTVRPGLLSWALEASLAPLPRRWRSHTLGKVMGSMTAHQAAGA
jgi:uncharacterized protein